MNQPLRMTVWLGVLIVIAGVAVAQRGVAVTSTPQPTIPGVLPTESLDVKSLNGRLFEPLLTYSVSAGDHPNANSSTPPSPPPDLHLCNTLQPPTSNEPWVAIFSVGATFPTVMEHEQVAGVTVSQIGDGYVRIGNGTMLMVTPCVTTDNGTGTATETASGAGTAGATVSGAPQAQQGTLIQAPPPVALPTATPYNPSLFGQPVQQQAPGAGPVYPGQTPLPMTIQPPQPPGRPN